MVAVEDRTFQAVRENSRRIASCLQCTGHGRLIYSSCSSGNDCSLSARSEFTDSSRYVKYRRVRVSRSDNRQSAQRSLIGPDARFLAGGMVELDTGNARYLIRFTQLLESQAGWSWALFNAVRKLS